MRSKFAAIGILIAALSVLSASIQRESPLTLSNKQLPCAGPESGHRDRSVRKYLVHAAG